MTLVNDLCSRMDALASYRQQWEIGWQEISEYCLPDTDRFLPGSSQLNPASYDAFARGPVSIERGRRRFDDTALRAVDRLASGMESLVTPQAQKWHGLAVTDPLAPEETDEEKEYFERYRDYMFAVRYNPRSGFIGSHQKAMRSSIALGTGVVFVEENMGTMAHVVPALYRPVPLSQSYIAVNAQGEPDTHYRKFSMSSRQMVQQFGEANVADIVRRSADNPAEKDRQFQIIHAVQPRDEFGSTGSTNRNSKYASYYIDRDNMMLLGQGGFYEFPFLVYYWQPVEQNIPYSQSPVMLALADIKGLNAIRKLSLRGLQGYMDPPWGIAHDGVMNRPNLNPGKINYKAISQDGRQLIQPLQPGARPDFVQEILEAERKNVNDSLYITLFQILMQNPDMTATEAMIRANEKGELLGPAGGKLQHTMATDVERLAGILERKGAMREGSPLQPPPSLARRSFGARFTSPLDRLRRSQEGIGIQRTLQTVLPLAQIDPSVADNFDLDEIARTVPEIEGAPHKILRTAEERDAIRQAKQQMQQAQAALEMAKTGGEAAKNIVPAVGQAAAILGNGMAGAPGQ